MLKTDSSLGRNEEKGKMNIHVCKCVEKVRTKQQAVTEYLSVTCCYVELEMISATLFIVITTALLLSLLLLINCI